MLLVLDICTAADTLIMPLFLFPSYFFKGSLVKSSCVHSLKWFHCTCSLQAVAFNFFVYSVLLFSSNLLGTVKRVLFVPHSQELKISLLLLLLSECCSLLRAAGGEVGRCSAVPESCSVLQQGGQPQQSTYLQAHPKPRVSTLLSQGTATARLQLSSKRSVLGVHASTSQHQGLGAALPGAVQPSSNPQDARFWTAQPFDFGTLN